jgi:hypothetical protein
MENETRASKIQGVSSAYFTDVGGSSATHDVRAAAPLLFGL